MLMICFVTKMVSIDSIELSCLSLAKSQEVSEQHSFFY
jgi:hypothetical protein